jgi:inosine-uridine nucleoside N-ribohydrolase
MPRVRTILPGGRSLLPLLPLLLIPLIAPALCAAPVPVVIDTDIGDDIDDALALFLATTLTDRVTLRAVTTVGHRATERAWAASKILDLAGRNDVPVHAGATKPVDGFFVPVYPLATGILDPFEKRAISPVGAAEALEAIFANRTEPPTEIVAIGPLTNIAAFLARRPDLARNVGAVTVMGGMPRALDFCQRHPMKFWGDFNLESDRAAAMTVLTGPLAAAGTTIRLVGAAVTTLTKFTAAQLAQIAATGARGSPAMAVLSRAMKFWDIALHLVCPVERPAAVLHDPLTLATAAAVPSAANMTRSEFNFGIVDGVFRSYFSSEAPKEGTVGPISVSWSAGLPNPGAFDNFTFDAILAIQ